MLRLLIISFGILISDGLGPDGIKKLVIWIKKLVIWIK
jgi:hypothetical protein